MAVHDRERRLPEMSVVLTRVLSAMVVAGWLVLLASCGSEPQQPSLIQEEQLRQERSEDSPVYVKREGLHVDVPYLAGKDWDALDASVIADQLGTEVERRELDIWDITEVDFGDKVIQIYDGKVFFIAYSFDSPMDLSTAMGVCGFPLRVPNRIDATNEVRVIHHWGMRQISLIRAERESDFFKEIRIWKFRPQELERTAQGG